MIAVKWSFRAQRDLAGIDDYYHPLDPDHAARAGNMAIAAARFLTHHPEAVEAIPETGLRKWRVGRTPYILLYRVQGQTLRIVRLVHAARDWQRFV